MSTFFPHRPYWEFLNRNDRYISLLFGGMIVYTHLDTLFYSNPNLSGLELERSRAKKKYYNTAWIMHTPLTLYGTRIITLFNLYNVGQHQFVPFLQSKTILISELQMRYTMEQCVLDLQYNLRGWFIIGTVIGFVNIIRYANRNIDHKKNKNRNVITNMNGSYKIISKYINYFTTPIYYFSLFGSWLTLIMGSPLLYDSEIINMCPLHHAALCAYVYFS
jgi:hypothetical protein